MIINDIVKNVETVIAVDIAKNSFQVFVSNGSFDIFEHKNLKKSDLTRPNGLILFIKM